ncbi:MULTISPECIES: 50S ribosomal protein L9 [16SrII (Peanut WB group)]|uniref:Large ribosomal subunit protein bL9 n=3 Tax=Candidatus Phytoplasma TaxID=33926 RepID=A0ABN0J7R2_PEWBP|nr:MULTISPECIES: 50S ribosomal protein L9 [16SrII (Peanut WB group)]QLL37098.1 cyclic-di-AMP phosphodiesterase ['Echinacea purpurea' witches'-broom phytoplasma]WEX20643.1 MAG: cyclic-di-AMP phosphodiesterase [Candidatus Phytoplasma aurantifolia]WKV64351.1 MAG: cyclic-di-AMP phosphodiesterase [Candidatus Phytoplasma australasiaticum]EMR14486.1 putative bifunctional signaling protein/50S ribosomal protein L9 [Peanut witches'-broom phytoplasma NTU2011]MDO8054826.1 50S ribosomal protein L9 ['Cleom
MLTLRKKNLNYKKIFLFIILIGTFLYMTFLDYDNIKLLIHNPNKEIQEVKKIIIKLFFSILGKLVIFFIFLSIYMHFQRSLKIKRLQKRLALWSKLSYYIDKIGEEVFNELTIGIIVINTANNTIEWINTYANKIFNNPDINTSLNLINNQMAELLNIKEKEQQIVLKIKDKYFDCLYKKEFNVFYLFDATQREKVQTLYHRSTPALIFLSFDNLENSLKNLDFSEQSQIKVEYLSAISDFFEIYETYLKQLSDDKFLLLLKREQLENMILEKFSILKNIRNISEKYKLNITLSMGIACYNLPFNQLAYYSQSALELAQKRGGDQVVINIENQKIQYFGATKTSLNTNSKIVSRVNSEIIKDLIQKHNNCFFMSHKNPDLDAFGSMIAIYKIASILNSDQDHYIIIDTIFMEKNFKNIYENLNKENPKLLKNIINANKANKIINKNSLIIIVDNQHLEILDNNELLNLTDNIIIIDHHRSSEKIISNKFAYIDASSSSTVEMIMELIYFLNHPVYISPLEATIMYGGMIIDTNFFTSRTSARTLEVASRLINMGAESQKIKLWLRQDFDQILEMNRLLSRMEIYMKKFAIITSDKPINDRSFLAKVAENSLNVQNIEAAFVIGELSDNQIGISARSCSDNINVQIIMEQMNGGGHINSAASQIKNSNIDNVLLELKNILKNEYQEGNENMKIILLEDLSDKGKKEEIIQVNPGFGNYLIRTKKALLANPQNIKYLEQNKKIKEEKEQQKIILMTKLKEEIEDKQITFQIKIGPNGEMHGKITPKNIIDELYKSHNILLDKPKIILDNEINALGIYKANIILKDNIIAALTINVKAKKS